MGDDLYGHGTQFGTLIDKVLNHDGARIMEGVDVHNHSGVTSEIHV